MKIKNITSQIDRFDFGAEVKTLLPGETYKFDEINPYIEGKIAIGHYELIEDQKEEPKTSK